MDYQRTDLPMWVQGWLEVPGPALVFIAKKTVEGPYLVDASHAAKEAFRKWTGFEIPILEQVEAHKAADLDAWHALVNCNFETISSLVFYQEEIAGAIYETIKIPISETFIVVLTRPLK